jgi:hypothetical protein
MDFTNIIMKKYLRNGMAASWLSQNDDVPPDWMLTKNGKKLKEYSQDTIDTFDDQVGKGKSQVNKNHVEATVANLALNYCGKLNKILAITGPNLLKHIELYLRSGAAGYMHVPEINPFTYLHMVNKARRYPEFYGQMSLHFAPAQTFKVDDCKFVDLDLMKTYKETFATLKEWLKFQSAIEGKKAFTFTVGIRKDGGASQRFSRTSKLFNILGAKLKAVDGISGKFPSASKYAQPVTGLPTSTAHYCYSRSFDFSEKGRIDQALGFSYADGSPMLCGLILYK